VREYLVAHELGDRSGVTIESAGKTYGHRTECWAIVSGKQFVFARTRFGRVMDKFHLGGSFERMANYAVSYEELCAVVEAYMGPSDRQRYELMTRTSPGTGAMWQGLIMTITGNVLRTSLIVLGRGMRLLLVVIVVPFVLRFFNHMGRNR
jgi:hypothetical protein